MPGWCPESTPRCEHYRTKVSCLQAVSVGAVDACVLPRFVLPQIGQIGDGELRIMAESRAIKHLVFAAHPRLPAAERDEAALADHVVAAHRPGQSDPGHRIMAPVRGRAGCRLRGGAPLQRPHRSSSPNDEGSGDMSLKYRIAATIFALEVVVIGAVLWITLSHSIDSVREQIARTEEVTLQLLADLSRAALLTDEFADLQTFIEGTRRDPRVITVVVGAADGRVVAATEPELIGAPFPELVVAREHRYWRQIEIRGRAGVLGNLAIKFSDQPC